MDAVGATVSALAAVLIELNVEIANLEPRWPNVLTNTRMPRSSAPFAGLGITLGTRVLGEFGDNPNRYANT